MWKFILHVPLTGVTGQKTRGSQKQGNIIAIMIAVICFHDFGFFYKSLSGTSPERTLKQNIVAPKLRKKKSNQLTTFIETELISVIPRANLLNDTVGSYAWIQELHAIEEGYKQGAGVWIAVEAVAGIFNDWLRWGKEEVHCVQIFSVLAGRSRHAHGKAHWGSALLYSCPQSRWSQSRRR